MSHELPAPLVPPEVDLSEFPSFLLNVDKILSSELVALATPEEGWAAFMLWCRAWKQSPPGSLPDDDKVLASFSGAGKRWAKVKAMALRNFVKCADGRLYHDTLAAVANAAWQARLGHRERSPDSKAARQQRWRERCKAIGEELRELGARPPAGASLEALESLLKDARRRRETSTGASTSASTEASTVDEGETSTEIGRKVSEGKGSRSELQNRGSGVDPPSVAHEPVDNPAEPAILKAGNGRAKSNGRHDDAGQQWDNPAYVAASAKNLDTPRRENEPYDDWRDRVITASQHLRAGARH